MQAAGEKDKQEKKWNRKSKKNNKIPWANIGSLNPPAKTWRDTKNHKESRHI